MKIEEKELVVVRFQQGVNVIQGEGEIWLFPFFESTYDHSKRPVHHHSLHHHTDSLARPTTQKNRPPFLLGVAR